MLALEFNPTTKVPQGPRRPRLSFFRCNCQTARSRSPTDKNKTLRRPAIKAQFRPEFHISAFSRSPETTEISPPPPRSREELFGKFPKPVDLAASKAPVVVGGADIGRCEISVNAHSQT